MLQAQGETEIKSKMAEENLEFAVTALDNYFNRVSTNRLLNTPGLQPLRRELLLDALKYYESFVERRANVSELQPLVAEAYMRLGDIALVTGTAKESLPFAEKALSIYQQLAKQNPQDSDAVRHVARANFNCAISLNEVGNYSQAAERYHRAIELTQTLVDQPYEDSDDHFALATYHHNTGSNYAVMRRFSQARQHFDEAIRLLENCSQRGRDQQIGMVLDNLGLLEGEADRYQESLRLQQRSLEIKRRLCREQPESLPTS